jgi:hypothetical protein
MTLPTTAQAAQTLAAAARTLDLADHVRIQPSAPASAPAIDLKV